MPFAVNNGVHIHYQVVGDGPPLVLHHGLFVNWVDWQLAGYMDALKKHYRLILMDARGHGVSDKPHEADAYAMQHLVRDVVAVLDAEQIPKAHFLGYSWGAFVGYGIAEHAPDRFKSLILGGHSPQAGDPGIASLFTGQLAAGVEAFAGMLDQLFGPEPSGYKAIRLSIDFEAGIAVTQAWQTYSGFETAFRNMTMPCLLYIGEADGGYALTKEAAARIPSSKFVALPGLDHIQGFMQKDVVLPHLLAFLSEVG